MEAGQTIQGEIIEVVAAPSQAVEPRKASLLTPCDHSKREADGYCPNCWSFDPPVAPAPQKCEHDKGDWWCDGNPQYHDVPLKRDYPNCIYCAPKAQADTNDGYDTDCVHGCTMSCPEGCHAPAQPETKAPQEREAISEKLAEEARVYIYHEGSFLSQHQAKQFLKELIQRAISESLAARKERES